MAIRVQNADHVRRQLLRRLPRHARRPPRAAIALAIAVGAACIVLVGVRASAPVGPFVAAGPAFASGALERRPVELIAPEFLLYPQRIPAEEGWLTVPGDHGRPGTRTLRVHYTLLAQQAAADAGHGNVALVASANAAVAASDPAPILYLADSAAGSASASLAGDAFVAVQALRAHGAVIAFDPRDSIHAQPAAHCPGVWWTADSEPTSMAALQAQLQPLVRGCAEAFAEVFEGVRFDPSQSVADIEALRSALGIERLRLLASGDATPLALRYLAAHPQRVERVLLLGAQVPRRTAARPQHVESALERALAELRDDPYWSRRLPEPRESLRVAIARLDVQPVAQVLRDPHSGRKVSLVLGGADLRLAVLERLARDDGLVTLARLLEEVFAQRYALLAETALGWRRAPAPRAASLARRCTEEANPLGARRERMTAAFTLLGDAPDLMRQAQCSGWPRAPRERVWSAPRQPPPVLLVAGDHDPLAPLEQAQALAAQLPGSTVLRVAAGAPEARWHVAMQAQAPVPPAGRSMLAFLDGGDVDGGDVDVGGISDGDTPAVIGKSAADPLAGATLAGEPQAGAAANTAAAGAGLLAPAAAARPD